MTAQPSLRDLLAQAIHEDVTTDPAVFGFCVHDLLVGDWCAVYAKALLATPSGARLLAGHAALREALELIAADGCEASLWANEDPPVPDRCLDPDYIDEDPPTRCPRCVAHAALAAHVELGAKP